VGGTIAGVAPIGTAAADSEETFSISYPSDKTISQGEQTTFEFSVEQVGEGPDGDGTASVIGWVGFRYLPDVADINGTPTEWKEYTIENNDTDQSIGWSRKSPTQGVWKWSTPEDMSKGDTHSFSVTIEVDSDAATGTHDISLHKVTYLSGFIYPETDQTQKFVSLTVEGANLELTVSGGEAVPGGTATVTYTLSNVGETTIGDDEYGFVHLDGTLPAGWTVLTEGDVEDGGVLDGGTWGDWVVEPGEEISANLEVSVPADSGPGVYNVTGTVETDSPVDSDPATVTVEKSFDPLVHGFGFENYDTPDRPSFGNVLSVVQGSLLTELENLDINTSTPGLETTLAVLLYSAFEGGLTNGHCLGMTLTAREYYNNGIPELEGYDPGLDSENAPVDIDIPAETAVDIVHNPENRGALNPVESDIDQRQQTQAFDSTYVLRYLGAFGAPSDGVGSLNYTALLKAIKERVEVNETAPIYLANTIESGHMVLAYDMTAPLRDGLPPVDETTDLNVSVYDPNYPFSTLRRLSFSRPSTDDEFDMESYDSNPAYERAAFIEDVSPDYEFFTGSETRNGLAEAVSRGLGDYLTVGVMSPVTVEVTGPDGSTLSQSGVGATELEDETGYEELHFGTGISPGDYDIEVTGTDDGEYTVEVQGVASDGGQINDSYTGSIESDETQTLTASVPDTPDEDGSVGSGDGNDGSIVDQYDSNNDGTIDIGELGTAASDFAMGDLSIGDLATVAAAFAGS